MLHQDILYEQITREHFRAFPPRAKTTLESIPIDVVEEDSCPWARESIEILYKPKREMINFSSVLRKNPWLLDINIIFCLRNL